MWRWPSTDIEIPRFHHEASTVTLVHKPVSQSCAIAERKILAGHRTIKLSIQSSRLQQKLPKFGFRSHTNAILASGAVCQVLSAKFDCPVARQDICLLATAHDCETGVLGRDNFVCNQSLNPIRNQAKWLISPINKSLAFDSTNQACFWCIFLIPINPNFQHVYHELFLPRDWSLPLSIRNAQSTIFTPRDRIFRPHWFVGN